MSRKRASILVEVRGRGTLPSGGAVRTYRPARTVRVVRRFVELRPAIESAVRMLERGWAVRLTLEGMDRLPIVEGLETLRLLRVAASGGVEPREMLLDALDRTSTAVAWRRGLEGRFAAAVGNEAPAMLAAIGGRE